MLLTNIQNQLRDLLVYRVGKNLLWQFEAAIPRYSLVGDTPFLDSDKFSWTALLEDNWESINQELGEILKYKEELPTFQDISPDQASISSDNLWKTYFLYGYGIKFDANCDRLPETTRIIEQIPGMKTAFFSILMPGKHIPEHRGPYKGVLRCHLGLIIPQPGELCAIRVGDEVRHWQPGKCLVFDDSYPHEAWNKTDEIRVVLFLDIIRPMRFPLSVLNQALLKLIQFSPFVQDANTNRKKWDERLAKIFSKVD